MERAGEGDEAPASPAPRDDGAAAKDEDWSEAIAAVVDAVDERMRLSEEHERFEVGGESPARETQDVGARTPRRREIPITAGPSRTPSPAGALRPPELRRKSADEGGFLRMSPSPDAQRRAAERRQRQVQRAAAPEEAEYDVFDFFVDAWRALTRGSMDDSEFHRACLRRARKLDLSGVANMKLFDRPKGVDAKGRPSLLVYGAHYRRKIPDDDDESFQLILLAVKEIDEVGPSPDTGRGEGRRERRRRRADFATTTDRPMPFVANSVAADRLLAERVQRRVLPRGDGAPGDAERDLHEEAPRGARRRGAHVHAQAVRGAPELHAARAPHAARDGRARLPQGAVRRDGGLRPARLRVQEGASGCKNQLCFTFAIYSRCLRLPLKSQSCHSRVAVKTCV